jgi:hypothetical protein
VELTTQEQLQIALTKQDFSGKLFYSIVANSQNMIVNEHNSMPYMKSMANCLNRMVSDGYTEDFKVTETGLEALKEHAHYAPEQVQVVNFFRFEGESDPDDNAILYVIETRDGKKGTLIDAYGIYNDALVSGFMKNVDVHKKLKN